MVKGSLSSFGSAKFQLPMNRIPNYPPPNDYPVSSEFLNTYSIQGIMLYRNLIISSPLPLFDIFGEFYASVPYGSGQIKILHNMSIYLDETPLSSILLVVVELARRR